MTVGPVKRALQGAALTCGAVVVALLLAEGALRLAGRNAPWSYLLLPPHAHVRDVQTDWDVTYDTNALGLRDDEVERERHPGTRRIVTVGDSYTFGQGCERGAIFPDRLEALLSEGGAPVDVVNVSRHGLGPADYAQLVRDVALPLSPDVIVVTVFGNDASELTALSASDRAARALASRSHLVTLLRELRRGAHVRTAETRVRDLLSKDELPNDPGGVRAAALREFRAAHGNRTNNLVAALALDPGEVERWLDPPTDGAGWRLFVASLDAIDAACRKAGVRLVLGIVPDSAAVDAGQAELRRRFGVALPEDVLTAPFGFETKVKDYAASRGIPFFDPTASFRAAGSGLHFPGDAHWSPAGHDLYARELSRFLGSLP